MTAVEDEEIPVHEGPDPRDWERNSLLSMAAQDVRAADAMLELLQGTRPKPSMSRSYAEALTLLETISVQAREVLASQVLDAYKVILPEPEGEEVIGAPRKVREDIIRGTDDNARDRDHLRE